MTMRRVALVFVALVALQGVVFAFAYDDLLYLRQPVALIDAGPRDTFERRAQQALSRPHLTARHLETNAAAAQHFALPDLESRALERRAAADPNDRDVQLRLADAYRRAGRFDRAVRLYLNILNATGGAR